MDRLIEAGLIGLLLFAPLPLGSVLPWASGVIEATGAGLLVLWLGRSVTTGELVLRFTPLGWPGLALAGLVALQLALGRSADPHATWGSLRLYLAYLGVLWVLTQHLVTRARIVRLLAVVIGWGTALALVGLVSHGRGLAPAWWLAPEASTGPLARRLVSTFVNPNHQAFYWALLLLLAVGLLWQSGWTRRSATDGARAGGGGLLDMAGRWDRVLLAGATLMLATALLLTGSRGGILSATAGLVALVAVSAHGRARAGALAGLGALVAGAVLYASWVGLDPVVGRFAGLHEAPVESGRWSIWAGTLRLAGDAPLLGTGLGTLASAFPPYRPATLPPPMFVDYAHQDYLQLLAETGLPGLGVLAWALVVWGRFVLPRFHARRDPFVRGVTLGGLGALTVAVVHSALDFSLHMPANALLVVLIAAMLPAVVTLRSDAPGGDRVGLPAWRHALGPGSRLAGVAAAALLVAGVGLAVAPPALADWEFRRVQQSLWRIQETRGLVSTADLAESQARLARAAARDPDNPALLRALGDTSAELATRVWNHGVIREGRHVTDSSPTQRVGESVSWLDTAYRAYRRTLRPGPFEATVHDRLGWLLGGLESYRVVARATGLALPASLELAGLLRGEQSLVPEGLGHLRRAAALEPHDGRRGANLARFALIHAPGDPASRAIVRDAFHAALVRDPGALSAVLDQLFAHRADDALVLAAVPQEPPLLVALAAHAVGRERPALAERALGTALALDRGPAQELEVRLAYVQLRLGTRDPAGALVHATRAQALSPDDPEIHAALASVFERLDRWQDAEAALVAAIRLTAPSGPGPRRANGYRGRLAALLARTGQPDRALAVQQEILEAAPNDPRAHLGAARLFEQHDRWPEAFGAYRLAEALGREDAGVQDAVAAAYARHDLLFEAATALERAVTLQPAHARHRTTPPAPLTWVGRAEEASRQYRAVLDRDPGHQAARRDLGALDVHRAGAARPGL